MTDAAANRDAPRRGFSLVALLGFVLVAELWLNRIAARLARAEPGLAGALHHLDLLALFAFQLASVLSTLLLGWAIVRVVAKQREAHLLRASISIIGGMTVALTFGGVWLRLPMRLMVYLYTSTLFLLFVVMLGTVTLAALRRLRIGVALLSVPVMTMLVAELFQRYAPSGLMDPRASALRELSGVLFVLAGLLSPVLFPASRRRSPLAATFGAVVLCVGLVMGRVDAGLTARLVDLGLGVAVPIASWGLPVYILGAAAYTFTIVGLLAGADADRLRGLGVLLVCAIGLQVELPYQLASVLLGFFCLLESVRLEAPAAMSREDFDAILRHTAALVGSQQVTVVGDPGRELARIAFDTAGRPSQLVLERRASVMSRVEISIGEILERAPTLSLATRGSTGLGPSAAGPVVVTEDAPFDRLFVVRDHHGSAAVLDEPTRARLTRLAEGWIGVWPQRGARFRGRTLPVGDDGPAALSQLLADLAQRTGA